MQLRKPRFLIIIFSVWLLTISCSSPVLEEKSSPDQSEKRCGDGICDGPENVENCAEDCSPAGNNVLETDNEDESDNGDSDSHKIFNITINIVFESDISKIPGYDGSPYSEPIGYGLITLEAAFPDAGGYDLYNQGTITLTNYEEKGPYCTLEVPENMIGASSPISWENIYWDPEGRMTFEADVSYDNLEFNIVANCPPLSAPLVEYPIYKLVGIFNEEMRSLSIDLNTSSHTFDDLHWGMHDTMQTDIDIILE